MLWTLIFKILVKVFGHTCEGDRLDILLRKVKLQLERKECNALLPKKNMVKVVFAGHFHRLMWQLLVLPY